jgi:hypothetical protein
MESDYVTDVKWSLMLDELVNNVRDFKRPLFAHERYALALPWRDKRVAHVAVMFDAFSVLGKEL